MPENFNMKYINFYLYNRYLNEFISDISL